MFQTGSSTRLAGSKQIRASCHKVVVGVLEALGIKKVPVALRPGMRQLYIRIVVCDKSRERADAVDGNA